MKKLTFAIFMLLSVSSCFSQWEAWYPIPFPSSQFFNDIQFLNGDFGVAVYNDGYGIHLKKTMDKGYINTWNDFATLTGTNDYLNASFAFLNSTTGFIEYGNVIDRVDLTNGNFSHVGDIPVTITQYGPFDYPCKIRMVNSNLGYAMFSGVNNNGYSCYGLKITTNGGNSWQTQFYSEPPFYQIKLWDFDYSKIHNNNIILCGFIIINNNNLYTQPCWLYSTNYGQSFTLLYESETNEFNYVNFLPGSDNFIMTAPGIVDKGVYSNGSWTKSQISNICDQCSWQGENWPLQGLTFINNNTGYIAMWNQWIYITTNGGYNWFTDYNINAQGLNECYRMESLGDKVFYSDIGEIYIKQLSLGLNTNFDWQQGQGHIIVNGNTENTSQDPYYYLGGNTTLSLERQSTNEHYEYYTSGSDTIARFYYWGGNLNQSLDPTTNSSYFINSNNQLNADYVSTLKSTDYNNAISYSNQIKSVLDKNGVMNIIRETEGGGIFYTRTRNTDKHYKAEELVSRCANNLYASWGCVNPYISEINQYSGGYVNPEQNIVATYECPSGSNTNIYVAERMRSTNNWDPWQWNVAIDPPMTVYSTTNCFPKIWATENQNQPPNQRYAVLTHLQNVNGNNAIVASCFFGFDHVTDINLTSNFESGNISEYTAACSISYNNFDIYCFYRVGNSIKFFHTGISGSGWGAFENSNERVLNFNNSYQNKGNLDITLRNVNGNMQPVVIFNGTQQVYIKIPDPNGNGPVVSQSVYYPVSWIQRNYSGGPNSWVPYQTMLSTYLQNNCNLEGSTSHNSYFVNYWKQNPSDYGFSVIAPLWNGSTGYYTSFCDQDYKDAKIVKSTIDNSNNNIYQILTINPSGNVYQVATQNFTISPNNQCTNLDVNEVSAAAFNDNVQYCFNLGSIIVNSNQIGFDVSGDTAIEDVSDMNDCLSSNAFWLNDGDTLIVGRSAFYLNPDSANNFKNVIYSTVLMRNSNDMPVCTLDMDTLQVGDSADVEALYGYVISGYGSDSFYVEIQADTLWNIDSSIIGGASGGFSAITGGGGDNVHRPLKDLVFFKNKIKNPINAIPTVFNLHQNYPNPFNPATTIKYDIPASPVPSKGGVQVTLKVYDILGREVSTLVNEVKQPGYYEAEFNGTNLASGIYFYRINAGKFTSVKKMVLIK